MLLAIAHDHALDVALGHRHQRLVQRRLARDGDQRALGEWTDRIVGMTPAQGQRFEQIGASDDAGTGQRVLDQQAVHAGFAQATRDQPDRGTRRQSLERGQVRIGNARHQQAPALGRGLAGSVATLDRHALAEPGTEAELGVGQLAEDLGWDRVAEGVLGRAVTVAGAAREHGMRAEEIPGT